MLNIVSFVDLEKWISRVYQGQRVLIKPWTISFDFTTLAANSDTTATQKINSNADFVLCSMAHSYETSTGNSDLLKVQIEDNASLERFYNDFVRLNAVSSEFGESFADQQTYRRIAGNSSVTMTIRNGAIAQTGTQLQVTMRGVLVFPYSRSA